METRMELKYPWTRWTIVECFLTILDEAYTRIGYFDRKAGTHKLPITSKVNSAVETLVEDFSFAWKEGSVGWALMNEREAELAQAFVDLIQKLTKSEYYGPVLNTLVVEDWRQIATASWAFLKEVQSNGMQPVPEADLGRQFEFTPEYVEFGPPDNQRVLGQLNLLQFELYHPNRLGRHKDKVMIAIFLRDGTAFSLRENTEDWHRVCPKDLSHRQLCSFR